MSDLAAKLREIAACGRTKFAYSGGKRYEHGPGFNEQCRDCTMELRGRVEAAKATLEAAREAQCNWCKEKVAMLDGRPYHAFRRCECGHGENYHRPYCHSQCRCKIFKLVSGIETQQCSAWQIRALSASLESHEKGGQT